LQEFSHNNNTVENATGMSQKLSLYTVVAYSLYDLAAKTFYRTVHQF